MIDVNNTIASLRRQLIDSLKDIINVQQLNNLITDKLLTRPPFPFIQTLVRLYVDGLGFAKGLYTKNELDCQNQLTKSDKIRFLVKILSCVSIIIGERVDIFVSPAKILSGQDVENTQWFFQTLIKASKQIENSHEAALSVIQEGETNLYKRAVRTRNYVIKLQARVRSILSRKRHMVRKNNINNQYGPSSTKTLCNKYIYKQDKENQEPVTPSQYQNAEDISPTEISRNEIEVNVVNESTSAKKLKKISNEYSSSNANDCTEEIQPLTTNLNMVNEQSKFSNDSKNILSTNESIMYSNNKSILDKSLLEDDFEQEIDKAHRDFEEEMMCLQVVLMNEKERQRARLRERMFNITQQSDPGDSSGTSSPHASSKKKSEYVDKSTDGPPYSTPSYENTSQQTIEQPTIAVTNDSSIENNVSKSAISFNKQDSENGNTLPIQFHLDSATQYENDDNEITIERKYENSLRVLQTKFMIQMKKLKQKEVQLTKQEEELGGKNKKVQKLAESLRRRYCQVKREHEKLKQNDEEKNFKNSKNYLRNCAFQRKEPIQSSNINYIPHKRACSAPCVQCLKTSKQKILFQEKENEIKEKQRRILKLAETLRRQRQQLKKKEKINNKIQKHLNFFTSSNECAPPNYASSTLSQKQTSIQIDDLASKHIQRLNEENIVTSLHKKMGHEDYQKKSSSKKSSIQQLRSNSNHLTSIPKSTFNRVEKVRKGRMVDKQKVKRSKSHEPKRDIPIEAKNESDMAIKRCRKPIRHAEIRTDIRKRVNTSKKESTLLHSYTNDGCVINQGASLKNLRDNDFKSRMSSSIDLIEQDCMRADNLITKSIVNKHLTEERQSIKTVESCTNNKIHKRKHINKKSSKTILQIINESELHLNELHAISYKGNVTIDQFRQHMLETVNFTKAEAKKILRYCENNLDVCQHTNRPKFICLHQLDMLLRKGQISKVRKTEGTSCSSSNICKESSMKTNIHKVQNREYINNYVQQRNQSKEIGKKINVDKNKKISRVQNDKKITLHHKSSDWETSYDNQLECALQKLEVEYNLKPVP